MITKWTVYHLSVIMPVQATFRLPRRPTRRHKTHRMTGVEGEAQTAKTANAELSLVGGRSARVFWRQYYNKHLYSTLVLLHSSLKL